VEEDAEDGGSSPLGRIKVVRENQAKVLRDDGKNGRRMTAEMKTAQRCDGACR